MKNADLVAFVTDYACWHAIHEFMTNCHPTTSKTVNLPFSNILATCVINYQSKPLYFFRNSSFRDRHMLCIL